jgi:NitT/TauT family transport system permease protein
MLIETKLDTAVASRRGAPNILSKLWDRVLPILLLIAVIGLIEGGLRFFQVPVYVMPPPSAIFLALIHGFDVPLASPEGYYLNILTTLTEAVVSFIIGSILGIFLGGLIVEFPRLRKLAMPYIYGLQSVPKVALAPLFVVWFGFGMESKIFLGILLTFFPLLINTAAGLVSVERDRIDLMLSLKATPWTTFRLIKFPTALPYIFAGLEMAVTYSVLGAVVGEFVGGNSGLGVLILSRNAALDISGSMATLVLLAIIGIALQRLVSLARARILFWAPSHDALLESEEELN